MPDLWQALTKAALRIIHERDAKPASTDVDEITDTVLTSFGDFPDIGQYRDRLKKFVSDILRL